MSTPEAGTSQAPPQDVLDTPAAGRLLVRGSVLRFAGYAGMMGLSVVMAAVLTRHLGVVRFGLYTTIMSVTAVVQVVTDAGMSAIGTREYAVLEGPDRDQLMENLLTLRVLLTLIGVLLTTGFAVAADYYEALVFGAATASLATVPLVFQHTLSIPLQTELRLGLVAALELARQFLWVAGIVVLAALGAGVFPLLSVPLLVNLILILPTARLVRGKVPLRPALRPRAWPALFRTTIVYSVATAVGVIYAYAAQILTSLVASHHQSGLFAVSFRVFIVLATVPALLAGSALPVLARAAGSDSRRLDYGLQRMFEILLVAGVGTGLIISAGSGFIVSVVAGPSYAKAAPVLSLQAFALIGSFLAGGWSFALLSLRMHRQLLLANAASLLLSVVLTLILARADGARGAAIATICGEAALAAGTGLALARERPSFRPDLGMLGKVITAAAAAGVAALVPSLPSILRAVIAGVVYALLLWVMRALPRELWELLPDRQQPKRLR